MVSKKDKYLAAAQKFLERGSLDKALAEFQRAVQEDPKDTRTWLRIAEIHVKRGDNEKATEVYLRTADLYVEQGFFQRAVAVYKNIVKLTPGFVDAYLKLADIYKQLGLLSDAIQQYEQAAAVHQRAGKLKEAMGVLRLIVDINPDQPVSRIKLAEAASQAGNVPEAVAEFQRAGDLLRNQGRIDEYLRVAERLLFHQPENVTLSKQVAQQYIERNNARFALAKLQACFKIDPRDTETLDLLARAFEQLGQTAKTISVLKELAKVYGDTRRTAERTAVARRIVSLDPADAEAREILGMRGSTSPAPGQGAGTGAPAVSISPSRVSMPSYPAAGAGQSSPGMPAFGTRPSTSTGANPLAAAPPAALRGPVAPAGVPVTPPAAAPASPAAAGFDRARGSGPKRPEVITFSEMAVPQFLQNRDAEPPPVDDTPRVDTAERMAVARGMLERGEEETGAEVQRIIAEADVFVKYGLVERASDHLRKVFELQPTHTGAHERLAAVLLELGRKGEAVMELEGLAEQLALSQPESASDYARRALAIDGNSRRAHKVLETLAGGRTMPVAAGDYDDDGFEEISTGMIEVDDLQPPAPVVSSTSSTAENEAFGTAPGTFGDSAPPPPELDLEGLSDEMARLRTDPGATRVLPSAAGSGQVAIPPGLDDDGDQEFTRAERTTADDGMYTALLSDLEQIDFFLDQGMAEDAQGLLDDVQQKYPPSPLIDDRRSRLRQLEGDQPGAVPMDSGGQVGHPMMGGMSTANHPKAMVASGGEMDLASHKDLGIGYKDMGLFDAAINEFSILAGDPGYEVFALTMIGECHESKGALAEAVAYYKKALNRPSVTDAEATQLYYQLGSVFQSMGETNEALYFFEKVIRRDAGFRDVRKRLAELRGPTGVGARGGAGSAR